MICGLILAGGRSTRFGAEKAVAPFLGRPLIAHAHGALAACTAVAQMRSWQRSSRCIVQSGSIGWGLSIQNSAAIHSSMENRIAPSSALNRTA